MQVSQTTPILLSLCAAFLGAWAQYFYKIAAVKFSIESFFRNYHLFAGVISFTLVLILFMLAFRMGGKMFVIYPVYASTYVWSGLIAYYITNEPINLAQISGTALIILGVSIISFGHTSS